MPPSVAYLAYLASPAWRARRAAFVATHGALRCAACGSGERADLHHLTYERLGAELDADLTPLCRRCHEAVHHAQRQSGRSLADVTRRYIRRRSLDLPARRPRKHPGAGIRPRRYLATGSRAYNKLAALAVSNDELRARQDALRRTG